VRSAINAPLAPGGQGGGFAGIDVSELRVLDFIDRLPHCGAEF